MPNYDTVLLDADQTLFDFKAAERSALEKTLLSRALPFSGEILERYSEINEGFWRRFERGEVQKDVMLVERFQVFLQTLSHGEDAAAFNRDYLTALGEGSELMPGAYELCAALHPVCSLYIATNGVFRTQTSRIKNSRIAGLISGVFVSEAIGSPKPSREYFDAVFEALGLANRSRAIILGDSLSSDILGGKNAGISTCWIAPEWEDDHGIVPDYRISELSQFIPLILGE